MDERLTKEMRPLNEVSLQVVRTNNTEVVVLPALILGALIAVQ